MAKLLDVLEYALAVVFGAFFALLTKQVLDSLPLELASVGNFVNE